MATPPYGRRGKGRTKAKKAHPTKVAGQPSSSAMAHASPNARFKRTAAPGASSGVKPLASGASRGRSGKAFTSQAGAKAGGRVGPKPATSNSGADTAPKSPRPVAGSKGPHPSAQAIAHASPNARFKRTSTGTTAPAPHGLGGVAKSPKAPKAPRGRALGRMKG